MLKISPEIMDFFYPIGTYYETSNTSFDPNIEWGGTWVLDSQGKITVAQDGSDYSTIGSTGGGTTTGAASGNTGAATGNTGSTTLTINQIPAHNHTLTYYVNSNLPGGVDHLLAYGNTNGKNTHTSSDTGWIANSGGGKGHTHTLNSHTHTLNNHTHEQSMPPYVVVKRWHRTA